MIHPRTPLWTVTLLFMIPVGGGLSALAAPKRLPSQDKGRIELRAIRPGAQKETEAASAARSDPQTGLRFLATVVDENGVVVPSARVILTENETQTKFKGETDYAGKYEIREFSRGLYHLLVEKEGFFAVARDNVQLGETEGIEVVLNHQQEFVEHVNVTYSPPSIDPKQTTASSSLNSREIIDLPYTVKRDVRHAFPLLPGVLQDVFGQLHVNGSSTNQIVDQLDGFNITNPVNGLFSLRVSVDAIRSADVKGSRYPVEFGKGSGGIVSLTTGMGDDHFRYVMTDFTPSLQSRKGLHVNGWTPRGTFSGPLRKGKAWFLDAPEGEYHLDIIKELPRGADRTSAWRFSNLAKAQVNLTPANILTTSFLVNRFHERHFGLSRFDPLETTVNLNDTAYLLTMKDLAYFSNGVLLEAGIAMGRFHDELSPLGSRPYVINPEGTSGNFFRTSEGHSGRLQGIANLYLPPFHWKGRHEFKVGTDIDRITYDQSTARRPFSIVREDGTVSRRVTFAGNPSFERNNLELSAHAQDRWSLSDRLLMETGVRLDWDEIVRRPALSPRWAGSYLLSRNGNTKLVWGVGVYYDASSLQFIARPLTGRRMDFFFDRTGEAPARAPVETSFRVDERRLKEPRFLNWSVGMERKLPAEMYVRLEFVQKRGRDGWTFINQSPATSGGFSGLFDLQNERRDRYDAFGITIRRAFKAHHVLVASYTRSAARSNAVLNFSLDNPLFSPQAGGPLPWDAPNRFQSWGLLPFWKGIDLVYMLDGRDGFPFTLFNQDQRLVGAPGSRRFPTYFVLNLALERRFRILGFEWALRAGFDDITNRHNPSVVNSNVDSPQFLTFGGIQGRVLNGRIRLLGRK